MKKTDPLSVTAGVVLTIGGITLLTLSIIIVKFLIIYALIALILGIVILTTLKQQEHIEPIKIAKELKRRLKR